MTTITSVSAEKRAKREASRVLDSTQHASTRHSLWPPSSRTVLVCATLFGIFALGWFGSGPETVVLRAVQTMVL